MKSATVPFRWLASEGYRLDAQPFLSGGIQLRHRLLELKIRKDPLRAVTTSIFHAGRETRSWVTSNEHGVPFLGSTDIVRADLSTLSLISNKAVARNPLLLIQPGWTLITRSGTIGRMAFSREDMRGLACTEDVLRVVPNEQRILPGYLYAFLASTVGNTLITSRTYGAIITHLEPDHISDLPVPRLEEAVEESIHERILRAAEMRCRASRLLSSAQDRVCEALRIGPPSQSIPSAAGSTTVSIKDVTRRGRLDGFYYNQNAIAAEAWARRQAKAYDLGDIADVVDVPPFKHIYVDANHGVPFFTSGDIFKLKRHPDKYLSTTQTVNLSKYILEPRTILLARSGQLGGIIGRPQFADSGLVGAAASDHVIRIVPKVATLHPGYLFAYLSTPHLGYVLLTRTMCGKSVPALWPSQLSSVPVVLAEDRAIQEIGCIVEEGFELRVAASRLEDETISELETRLFGV